MVIISEYVGKKVAVFGLGRSGDAAIKFLLGAGAEVYAWDDNEDSILQLKEKYPDANFIQPDKDDWSTIKALVLSPGVPLTHPEPHPVVILAKENNCKIICDIELLYKSNPDSTYIGITGTNGKSTTTALIGHASLLSGKRCVMGGNIGTPAVALPFLDEDGVYVLEVSSYQLDLLTNTKFNIAALINVTADHIDRHGGMDGYIQSKKKIFARQKAGDFSIICVDDPYTESIYQSLKNEIGVKIVPVSTSKILENGIYINNNTIFNQVGFTEEKFEIGEIKKLPGKHNLQNIVVAFAVLRSMGIKGESILSGIRSFPGLKHRIEHVAEINGIKYINDSKATNAVAAEKALSSFDNIYWIAGGIAKEGGISLIEPMLPKIKGAFLIGEAEEEFAKNINSKIPVEKCGNLKNAFEMASQAAQNSGIKATVLLSPACASFDQFKNFEERGNAFCALVKELEGGG